MGGGFDSLAPCPNGGGAVIDLVLVNSSRPRARAVPPWTVAALVVGMALATCPGRPLVRAVDVGARERDEDEERMLGVSGQES